MSNPSGLVPVEFNVVVQLDKRQEKTAGGIYLPADVQEREKLGEVEGVLVAISPLAFGYEDWPEGSRKPGVGDRVMISRHSGVLKERNGLDFRIIKDREVVAIVEEAS